MGPQQNQQNEGGQTGDEPELFCFIAAEHLTSCFPPSVSSASPLHPNDTHLLFPGEENQTIPPCAPAACFPLRTGATGREKLQPALMSASATAKAVLCSPLVLVACKQKQSLQRPWGNGARAAQARCNLE